MRKVVGLMGLVLLLAGTTMAQETPQVEVSAGYSFVRDTSGGPGSNLHGGSGSIAGNLNNWFGVVGDFGGYKVTGLPSGLDARMFTYLFGPRLSYRQVRAMTPFAQVLVGGAHASARLGGVSGSANAFAFTVGGGLDIRASEHVAIRLVQTEYLLTRFGNQRQDNVRFSAGIVFRFGQKSGR